LKNRFAQALIIVILCLPQLLMAQMKPVIHYTEDDGLAGNIVHDVAKDQKGNLWIATESGISKFDGENFRNLHKSDGLPSNLVNAIEIDDKNNVFVGCSKRGLAIIRNDTVINVLHAGIRYPDSFRRLHYSNHYKRLFAGTNYGLFMLSDSSLVPVIFPKDSKKKSSVMSITEYNSRIFFTTETPISDKCGLYELFPDTINPDESYASLISLHGKFASVVINDTLFSAEYNRVYTNPLQKTSNQRLSSIDSAFFIYTMAPVNKNKLIFGGYCDGRFKGNIMIYDPRTKKESPSPYQITLKTVYDIYNDTTNNITWLASDNGLTSIFDSPFEYYDIKNIGNILDIGFSGDSLMVLTSEKVYYMNGNVLIPVITKQQIFKKISDSRNAMSARYGHDFDKFVEDFKTFMMTKFYSDGHKLYVCSACGVVSVPDLKSYFPFGSEVFCIIDDHSAFMHPKYMNMSFYCSFTDTIEKTFPRLNRSYLTDVFKIIESKGTYYFASTYNGLNAQKDKKVASVNETNSLMENNLTDIVKDGHGNVWCSSANCTLFQVYFTDSLRVLKVLYPSTAGIVGNSCKWLYFNDKYLFVSTDKGLNVISLESLYSDDPHIERFYNRYNGYDFISAHSPALDDNGNIFVCTSDKIIKIGGEIAPALNLNIEVRNVIVNESKSSLESLYGKTLPYSTKYISFDFFAIKLPAAKNLAYSYKVNNGEWIFDNKIILQSLRSGRYEILLDVLNKETNKHFNKTVSIQIKRPFWGTWWFLSLVALAIAGLFFLIMRVRINRLKRFHEEKAILITRNSELKLRSLQLQMSPHFIFNALTSVQKFIMTKSPEEALIYLGNLASVIRTNLENAADEYIHLSYEIEFLKKYIEVEKMRFKDKLSVNFSNSVENENIMLPPMLVQPIIENSVKHGIRNLEHMGQINIDFTLESDTLLITIEDNGVGREFTKALKIPGHKSLGLNVIKQRLDLLNEKTNTLTHRLEVTDLYDEGRPSGTRVELFLSAVRAV